MSDETLDTAEGTAGDDLLTGKPSGPSKMVLIVLALAGAGVGGWFGGPLVTPKLAETVASAGSGGGHGEDDGAYGAGEGEVGDEPLVVDNLILNPASSGGMRFLVATLVLDTDEAAREELEARDAQVRDLLLMVLATRTTQELSDVSLREEIREDLRTALNAMLGYDGVLRIFLPQFVIQ